MFCNPDITCHQVSLDCILERYKLYKRYWLVVWSHCRLVGWLIVYNKPTNQHTNQPLFVGHNRPYDQTFPNRLFIELKSKYYAVIFRHWKFMFKRT